MKNNIADFDYDKIKDMEYFQIEVVTLEKMERNFMLPLIQMEVVINMIIMTEALMEMHHIIRYM